jgi:hypothetical protein
MSFNPLSEKMQIEDFFCFFMGYLSEMLVLRAKESLI